MQKGAGRAKQIPSRQLIVRNVQKHIWVADGSEVSVKETQIQDQRTSPRKRTFMSMISGSPTLFWFVVSKNALYTGFVFFHLEVLTPLGQASWLVKTYRDGSPVNGLADADRLITSTQPIAEGTIQYTDMLGFKTGEGTGHFSLNYPVPGVSQAQSTDNYAVEATGSLVVVSPGYYTFGLNTDDGARLRVDGWNIIVDDVRSPPHDSQFVTVYLSAGMHPVEWTWFNEAGGVNGGGAEAEVFWASGTHTGFDSSFSLLAAADSTPTDLVGWWPLRGNALDYSGNNLSGGASHASFLPDNFGFGLSCDGNLDSLVQVAPSDALSPRTAVTVSLWFYQRTAASAYACLAYKAARLPGSVPGFGDRSYSLWVLPGGRGLHFTSTGEDQPGQTGIWTSADLFSFNQWVHVVGIVDAANHVMSLYVNGTLAKQVPYDASSIIAGPFPFQIGSPVQPLTGGDQEGFDGLINEVRVYAKALSSSEVEQLYASGVTQPRGIDISDSVGTVDWQQVRDVGHINFVFIKASSGLKNDQKPNLDANVAAIRGRAPELLIGTYHFAYPNYTPANTGAAEAMHFLSVAGGYIGSGFLPPVLDIEDSGSPLWSPMEHMQPDDLVRWINDWAGTVLAKTHVVPIIYTGHQYAQFLARDATPQTLSAYPLWIWTHPSDPGVDPGTVLPWTTWTFEQYQIDQSNVPGISGKADLDIFHGDLESLRGYASGPALSGSNGGGAAANDGALSVLISALNRDQATMQISDDLVHWIDYQVVPLTHGIGTFTDKIESSVAGRFYRAKP
jgi:GH25 family lysozyme M1 (1,4-beta-N-acetylmuramidase)